MKPEEIALHAVQNWAKSYGVACLDPVQSLGLQFIITQAIAQALARVRAEAIEECAKVADTAGDSAAQDAYWAVAEKDLDKEGRRLSDMNTARGIASAIRALGGSK